VRIAAVAALVVACLHLVFGAIVRITGSGLGCGENWPKCYGHWFPPMNRPDLIVEVSHRYLASILVMTVLTLVAFCWMQRREPGVSGKGGTLRTAVGAALAVLGAAVLGGLTVKLGNNPYATVAHWLMAMTLLAFVAATAIRAGTLGGASAARESGSRTTARGAIAAAGLAIFAVAMGGFTANFPGAAVGCTGFPSCAAPADAMPHATAVQLTHRTIALLLLLHLIGMVIRLGRRAEREAPIVLRAARIALGLVVLQFVFAASMVLLHLPPVLRSLHEATGVGIWLGCFSFAYLAHRAGREPVIAAVEASPTPAAVPATGLQPATPPTMAVIVARGADL
jgi:heme A synthase